ncbi:MAG: hypothetical protein ABIQ95_10685 [Bdellovibrionia bacterium]
MKAIIPKAFLKNHFFKIVGTFGFAFLTSWLLFRTTGIHSDEINYLRIAEKYLFGDSYYQPKSCLFYIVNYIFQHSVGLLFGPLKPWSLYLTHILLISAGLVWSIKPIYVEGKKFEFFLAYLLLLVSPLTLLNSTQFMMETPLLLVLSLIFGCLFRENDHQRWIRGLSALAVSLKLTALSPLLLLALIFWKKDRGKSIALIQGMVLGYFITSALIFLASFFPPDFVSPPQVFKRQFSDFFDFQKNLRHIKMTAFYLYAWLFFIGPTLILGTLFHLRTTLSHSPKIRTNEENNSLCYLTIIIGSWALTFGIQMLSSSFYFRYAYPTLFIGLLAGIYYVGRSGLLALIPLVLFALAQSLPLVTYGTERFQYWPTIVNAEFFQARLTIFSGTPTHAALMGLRMHSETPCIELNILPQGEFEGWYTRYLQFVLPHSSIQPLEACKNEWKLEVKREGAADLKFGDLASLKDYCKSGQNYGGFQEIMFPENGEESRYLNSTCITNFHKF